MKHILPLCAIMLLFATGCENENTTIEYPAEGHYGPNILALESGLHPEGDYSMYAVLGEQAHLKVTIKGFWFYESGSTPRWYESGWDDATQSRTFTSAQTGELDGHMVLEQGRVLEISVFENDSETASFVKNITIGE